MQWRGGLTSSRRHPHAHPPALRKLPTSPQCPAQCTSQCGGTVRAAAIRWCGLAYRRPCAFDL
eukprot:1246735-Prymnesium_polylepis.2